MRPYVGANRFGAMFLVIALATVLGESKLLAQGSVIFACVNTTSGAVRLVFGGSVCKKGESPLQWNVAGQQGPEGPAGPEGPQGQPGEESVVALATTVLGMTKSATIPTLGVIEVRCNASGVPNVALQLPAGSVMRADETSINGTTQTSALLSTVAFIEDFTTADPLFGTTKQFWITILGADAQWKVDAFVRRVQPAGAGFPERPCTAAASVTIMP